MTISESKRSANARWDAAHMTNIACRVTREKAQQFREACRSQGTNPNAVLLAYISRYIEKFGAQEQP